MGAYSRLSRIYYGLKARCYNPKRKDYKDYGGRGIDICEEWLDKTIVLNSCRSTKGWLAFKSWALANGYKDNLTIDRIDTNEGYSPTNCRWVSMEVQSNNRRSNHFITYKGKTQSLTVWCDELGLNYHTISYRLNEGHWSVKKAFETPVERDQA